MLASQTIFDAIKRPITTTLNALIEELEYPKNSLEGLGNVLKVLSFYKIELDPPETEHDLNFPRTLKSQKKYGETEREITNILQDGGENFSVELKSSVHIDRKKQEHAPGKKLTEYVNDNLATKLAQEICAFLNRSGGLILLGIANDLSIKGCDDDLNAFSADGTPEDKADLLIRQIVEKHFVKPVTVLSRIQTECVNYKSKRIIILRIAKANSLILLKDDCRSSFQLYLRIGTNAQPIKFQELEEHYSVILL